MLSSTPCTVPRSPHHHLGGQPAFVSFGRRLLARRLRSLSSHAHAHTPTSPTPWPGPKGGLVCSRPHSPLGDSEYIVAQPPSLLPSRPPPGHTSGYLACFPFFSPRTSGFGSLEPEILSLSTCDTPHSWGDQPDLSGIPSSLAHVSPAPPGRLPPDVIGISRKADPGPFVSQDQQTRRTLRTAVLYTSQGTPDSFFPSEAKHTSPTTNSA